MSDSTAAPATGEGQSTDAGTTTGAETAFEAITSQEALDKIVGSRVARERAKYADYADLKAKAEGVGKLEEQLAEAQAKLAAFEHDQQAAAWRAQVSLETGVDGSVLRGETLEEMQAHAADIAKLISARPRLPFNPTSGDQPETSLTEEQRAVREIFSKN